ncbi:MAG TPA: aldose epimerase family protein [Solirubrobacter sp.]|nr:aldose epimerase family protein [Solirubrobacter sp.]
MRALSCGVAVLLLTGVMAAPAAARDSAAEELSITKSSFGSVGSQPVDRYTLANHDMSVSIITYGGIVQAVNVPDRHGQMANVATNFAAISNYTRNGDYRGAIIGRYSNRIAKGRFTLDNTVYSLDINNNPNTLHGGFSGFHTKIWAATPVQTPDSVGVKLTYTSPAGEGCTPGRVSVPACSTGFPGTVPITVVYSLDTRNNLRIDYSATTDAPTVLNLTNHSYWVLGGVGSGTINNNQLKLNADRYTPIDSTSIPTGALDPVAGTPMDFRDFHSIGERLNANFRGYDHNWVLNRLPGDSTSLVEAAKLRDPASGRTLTVSTDQPGIQFYSANGNSVALETQHFPDSPNRPEFPSTVLRPGETYKTTTVLSFGTDNVTRAYDNASGTVPATLALTLGTPATFGPFTPGATQTFESSTTANVISTAGDATLSIADPSSVANGHLVNGAFSLPEPLQARARNAANTGTTYADVGSSASPLTLLTWNGPVSNDLVTLSFSQLIKATDALRTGTYSKTLTATLSTTTP